MVNPIFSSAEIRVPFFPSRSISDIIPLPMDNVRKLILAISLVLIATGLITLGLNLFLPGSVNVSWPLAVIMLAVVFFVLVRALKTRWPGSAWLFIPGGALLALGLVFLVNVLTRDWVAWAYAWLLVLAGIGWGMLMTGRSFHWPEWVHLTGLSLVVGGITLAVLFGAIAGGRFLLVISPILLVAGGVAVWWLRPEQLLPPRLLARLRPAPANVPTSSSVLPTSLPGPEALAEPLSARELEVLRLIEAGLSNQQIAERLTVAPSTVKTHINNIYGKLGTESRVQALKKAHDLGLLPGTM